MVVTSGWRLLSPPRTDKPSSLVCGPADLRYDESVRGGYGCSQSVCRRMAHLCTGDGGPGRNYALLRARLSTQQNPCGDRLHSGTDSRRRRRLIVDVTRLAPCKLYPFHDRAFADCGHRFILLEAGISQEGITHLLQCIATVQLKEYFEETISMSNYQFTLRELRPADSLALVKLITEFGGDLTTRFQVDPYLAIISGTEFRTRGVVVECAEYDGLVGMGTVRFSKVQYNNEVLPLAFLDGLKVKEEFRGNGLGYQIASWRIQKAREEFGDHCVIGTGMLHDNHASHAVASKWCREFAEAAFDVRFVPMLTRRPKSLAGMNVGEINPDEYEEFAHKQNQFYGEYNLYAPGSPNSIAGALDVSVEGKKPYRYFAARDAQGHLLAGAQTWARGILKSDTVNNPPSLLRILNKVVHFLPQDFTLRDVSVSGLWYESGQIKVAQFLWAMLRWECRDQGTILATAFDSRDPAMDVVKLKPWNQPRPKITIAIHAPSLLDRDRLLFASGRV